MNETHTSPHPGTAPTAAPPTVRTRTRRRRWIVRAGLVVGISVATLNVNRLLERDAHVSHQQPQQMQVANVMTNQVPIEAPAAAPPKKLFTPSRAADRVTKSATPTPVATRKPPSTARAADARVEKATAPEDTAFLRSLVEADVMRVADAVTSAATAGSGSAPVTITGCLEMTTDGNEFRLADTQGDDAPKSRSWRTGFLTTRKAPVALIDPPESLGLRSNVGKRVAATGSLTSRNLTVSALRVVDPACN